MQENKQDAIKQEEPQQVIITETPAWSNPSAAGLVAYAVACYCFFAVLTGKVDSSAMPLLGCWLVGGFAIQIVVGIVDLKNRNIAGGNLFLFFSGFFMLTGGLEMFLKYKAIVDGAPLDTRLDGYAWLVLFIVVVLWTPAFCKRFNLLSVAVIVIDVALPLIAFADMGVIPASPALQIAAWALLISGSMGIYISAAIVVNGAHGKTIYPGL